MIQLQSLFTIGETMVEITAPPRPYFEDEPKEKRSQAERVIAKFGGTPRLIFYLNQAIQTPIEGSLKPKNVRVPSSVYRWMYPKSRGGCDGVIPAKAMKLILKASRLAGVLLTADDFYLGEL